MSITMPRSHATPDASQPIRSRLADDLRQDDEPSLFDREELRKFAADDSDAGRHIAKILCALFMYPLIVMTAVIWWTMRTVGH